MSFEVLQKFVAHPTTGYLATLLLLLLGNKVTNPNWSNAVVVAAWLMLGWSLFWTAPITNQVLAMRILITGAVLCVAGIGGFYLGLWQGPPELTYKDSPFLTPAARYRINRDVDATKTYLATLGLTPPAVPPIEVLAAPPPNRRPNSRTNFDQTRYVEVMYRYRDKLADRQAVTRAYIRYALMRLLLSPTTLTPITVGYNNITDRMLRTQAMAVFDVYFNDSFWNRRRSGESWPPWTDILWDVREQTGRDFAGLLIAATANAFTDNPRRDTSHHYNAYFVERLRTADALI